MFLALIAVPFLVAAVTFTDEIPIRAGEAAARTVIATDPVVLVDEVATERARLTAEESVLPILVPDTEAQANTVAQVRAVFDAVEAVRQPVAVPQATPSDAPAEPDGDPAPAPSPSATVPSAAQQRAALAAQITLLDAVAIGDLVALSDADLVRVETETVAIAQQLARQEVTAEGLTSLLDTQLRTEIAVRSFPGDTAVTVVEPLIREVLQPTMVVDPDATRAARERASTSQPDIVRSWAAGDIIVEEGEIVDALEVVALAQLGLEGSDPARTLFAAMLAMSLVVIIVAVYLRRMQPAAWSSARRVLALSTIMTGFAVLAAGVSLLVESSGVSWWYATPGAALAMLAAILVAPVAGVLMVLPAVTILLLLAPGQAAPAVYMVAICLTSVPLVNKLASRHDLRAATLRCVVIFPAIALAVSLAMGGEGEKLLTAGLAGLANGLATMLLVQGALPALEAAFRLPSVTALLDLADRNHPLLREVEQKALGTYNHSVMVAALVERACRAIGADPLLGQVAALYHDVGKIKRPHFFIENQQGIANPHDDLPPHISAKILHDHLSDGVVMAKEHRLPGEVIDAIGSHHGTMVVGFFHSRAKQLAEDRGETVDESVFRYPGARPRSKEAAILFICDSCEATTRAAAMRKGTLSRQEIEETVDWLIDERMKDHQFDEAELSFREFQLVRDAVVEALVGIYHPRIMYPKGEDRSGAAAAPAVTPEPARPPMTVTEDGPVDLDHAEVREAIRAAEEAATRKPA